MVAAAPVDELVGAEVPVEAGLEVPVGEEVALELVLAEAAVKLAGLR
jgi:hypothetical protein